MEEKETLIIERHGVPNRYDMAPKGTICYVKEGGERVRKFIQKSSSEFDPVWEEEIDC